MASPNSTETNSYDYQNKITDADGQSTAHDSRGNITQAGSDTYGYDVLNRLTQASVNGTSTTLSYDPTGRLYKYQGTSAGTKYMLYAGHNMVAETDASGNILRRNIPGPGVDELIVGYEGTGTSSKSWYHANAQGSVIARSNSAASASGQTKYDPYGNPSNIGGSRFKYTGQIFFADASIHHYKARAYSSKLGRFLQTDPIGYGDGLNMYAYVGGDPVNYKDPSGLYGVISEVINVTAISGGSSLTAPAFFFGGGLALGLGGFGSGSVGSGLALDIDDFDREDCGSRDEDCDDGSEEDPCSVPVPLTSNRNQTISPNQVRQQIRQEFGEDLIRATEMNRLLSMSGISGSDPYAFALGQGIGRTAVSLAPGGRFDTNPGNVVFGAATAEAGFVFGVQFPYGPLPGQSISPAQVAAHILELAEQVGLKDNNDDFIFDTPQAQRDIKAGAECPG